MKQVLWALVLLIFLMNCNSDDELTRQELLAMGRVQAVRNGQEWEAQATGDLGIFFPETFAISATRFNELGFRREVLGFSKLQKVFTRQELFTSAREVDSTAVFYTTLLDDGDVVGDVYDIVREGNENWIQITEIDERNRRVKGEFEIHLKISDTELFPEPNAEPTIDFLNGRFDVLAPEVFF